MAPSSPVFSEYSSDFEVSHSGATNQSVALSRWFPSWRKRQSGEPSRFSILSIFGPFTGRRPQPNDIEHVAQTIAMSRQATRQRPPLVVVSPAQEPSPKEAPPSPGDRRRLSLGTLPSPDNLPVSNASDTEGGKAPTIRSLREVEYPDWRDVNRVKDSIAGVGLGLDLDYEDLPGDGLKDENAVIEDEEDDAIKDTTPSKKPRRRSFLGPRKVANVSQVSNKGSTSDKLLRRSTGKDTEEIDDDKPLREGPSEAKFARDGFCTCSRFCRLTKTDFVLLAEVETAVQENWGIPFGKLNDIREVVKKVGQHPRYKLTAKYWLATSTPLMSWITLALRRREKNRSDNTFFYAIFRDKMQKSLRALIDQLITRYEVEYKSRPPKAKAKLEKLRDDIQQLSKKRKRLRHVEAGLLFIAPAATALDLPLGPEDWPLLKDLQMAPALLSLQSTISDNTLSQMLGPPFNDGQASTSAAGAARSQNGGATIDVQTAENGNVNAWANDKLRPKDLFTVPGTSSEASKYDGASMTAVPTTEHVENVVAVDQPLCASYQPKSVFIVVGWFDSELHEPMEIYARVDNLEHFLPDLKMHIMALRGWRSLFSFKSVQGFGLYKCHTSHFTHTTRHLSRDERVTLAHFFDATNTSYLRAAPKPAHSISRIEDDSLFVHFRRGIQRFRKNRRYAEQRKREDSRQWACWVHETMNLGKDCPFESQLSLKLLLNWSQGRIITAASVPLLLSFGVGLGFMLTHDGVESIATAWTIASYIVTAGAFIITLLAVLSALKDGQITVKQSDTNPE